MTFMTEKLRFTITHIPDVLEWFTFLIGTLLILIPLLQFLINSNKPNYREAVKICMEIIGVADFGTTRRLMDISPLKIYSMPALPAWKQSASPSADSVTSDLLVSKIAIDTDVCFLPEISTSMVAGLVNTGNSCFLNSVLQSLSSLPKLQAYLNQISSNYSTSHNLPVTRSLLKTLRLLSTPTDSAFRPNDLVTALASNLVNQRQQDAQELYQLLISALDNETQKQKSKQEGLEGALHLEQDNELIENPLNGLLASYTTCKKCKYSSNIPLQPFNNVQLSLPQTTTTTLNECLDMFTNIEIVQDVECSKCSLTQSVREIEQQVLSRAYQPTKAEEVLFCLKLVNEIKTRLNSNNIELDERNDAKLIELLKKVKGSKVKQVKIAKPPKVLCLHLVRSIYSLTGEVSKNSCHVAFPQMLNLLPYCTNDTPNLKVNSPVSAKYRLMSTVVHMGDNHESGHYISYKRRVFTERCQCERCDQEGSIDGTKLKAHDSEWFKTSDTVVQPCQMEDVLADNPAMLMYEMIDDEQDDEHIDILPLIETPMMNRADHDICIQDTASEPLFDMDAQEPPEEYIDDFELQMQPSAPPSSPASSPTRSSFPLPKLLLYTMNRHNNNNVNSTSSVHRLNMNNHPVPIPILSQ